jgi:hypothetical protein
MKIAALFLMLSLFFVSALDQKQDPTSSKTAAVEEENYEDLENLYEDATKNNQAKKNRDLGYYYGGGHGYGGGSSRYYSSYRSGGSGGSHSYGYSYGSHGSNYVRPTRVYPVVHDEPVVVHRYYNYYNRGKGKGMGSRK